jgi:hypothetical protein
VTQLTARLQGHQLAQREASKDIASAQNEAAKDITSAQREAAEKAGKATGEEAEKATEAERKAKAETREAVDATRKDQVDLRKSVEAKLNKLDERVRDLTKEANDSKVAPAVASNAKQKLTVAEAEIKSLRTELPQLQSSTPRPWSSSAREAISEWPRSSVRSTRSTISSERSTISSERQPVRDETRALRAAPGGAGGLPFAGACRQLGGAAVAVLANPGPECAEIDGLGQDWNAQAHAAAPRWRSPRADAPGRLLLKDLEQLLPGHDRHQQIEDHQAWLALAQEAQSISTVGGEQRGAAHHLHRLAQGFTNVRFVVDDQDACFGRALARRGAGSSAR